MHNLPAVPPCPVAMPDGHTKSIMVFTRIIWAVHHDINLKFCLIMIAINMINVSTLVMSSPFNQLGKANAFKHLCDMIVSFGNKTSVDISANDRCLLLIDE